LPQLFTCHLDDAANSEGIRELAGSDGVVFSISTVASVPKRDATCAALSRG
jgi:hypothetical protein